MQSLTKRASTSKASPNKNEASEQGVRPPAGRPGNLTSQQEDVLREFRSQLEEQDLLSADDSIGTSDSTLCRFLRARQFRLDKSMSMFRDCQHWRKHCFAGKSMDQLYEEVGARLLGCFCWAKSSLTVILINNPSRLTRSTLTRSQTFLNTGLCAFMA